MRGCVQTWQNSVLGSSLFRREYKQFLFGFKSSKKLAFIYFILCLDIPLLVVEVIGRTELRELNQVLLITFFKISSSSNLVTISGLHGGEQLRRLDTPDFVGPSLVRVRGLRPILDALRGPSPTEARRTPVEPS